MCISVLMLTTESEGERILKIHQYLEKNKSTTVMKEDCFFFDSRCIYAKLDNFLNKHMR